jgi:hypothetical protein
MFTDKGIGTEIVLKTPENGQEVRKPVAARQ